MEKEKLSLQSDTENYTGQVGNLKLLTWGLLSSHVCFPLSWLSWIMVTDGADTTETTNHDRNVPGERAQAAQVRTSTFSILN